MPSPTKIPPGRIYEVFLAIRRNLHARRASWQLMAPSEGHWQIEIRWSRKSGSSKVEMPNTIFRIKAAGVDGTVQRNLFDNRNAGRFNPLAVMDLEHPQPVTVTVADRVKDAATLTAIRIVRLHQDCFGTELVYEGSSGQVSGRHGASPQADWTMEGRGNATWRRGRLVLSPEQSVVKRTGSPAGSFVYWLNQSIPEAFTVEWLSRLPESETGRDHPMLLLLCSGAGRRKQSNPGSAGKNGGLIGFEEGREGYAVLLSPGRDGKAEIRTIPDFRQVAVAEHTKVATASRKWRRVRVSRLGMKYSLIIDGVRCLTWFDKGKKKRRHAQWRIGFGQYEGLPKSEYAEIMVHRLLTYEE